MHKSSQELPLIIVFPFMESFVLINELLCLKVINPFTGYAESEEAIGAEQANNILFMHLCPRIMLSFETV